MLKARYEKLKIAFDIDHVIFWSNLSRLNNLLVIMNISMFFSPAWWPKGIFIQFIFWLPVLFTGLIMVSDSVAESTIATAKHCYGCTAGAGSSCGGEISG